MTQGLLLNDTCLSQKSVDINNIKAVFTQINEKAYEVFLEISSHKFFIRIEKEYDDIENFEIIASKGFLELSQKSVKTLKNLTEHLRYRLA